jgi:hypothetical protein
VHVTASILLLALFVVAAFYLASSAFRPLEPKLIPVRRTPSRRR